jgi:hypothetical protein
MSSHRSPSPTRVNFVNPRSQTPRVRTGQDGLPSSSWLVLICVVCDRGLTKFWTSGGYDRHLTVSAYSKTPESHGLSLTRHSFSLSHRRSHDRDYLLSTAGDLYAHQNNGKPLNLDFRVFAGQGNWRKCRMSVIDRGNRGDVGPLWKLMVQHRLDSLGPSYSFCIFTTTISLAGLLLYLQPYLSNSSYLPLPHDTIPRHADVLSIAQLRYVSQQLHLPLRPILAPSRSPNRATYTPFS